MGIHALASRCIKKAASIASHTPAGKRIARGIAEGKGASWIKFHGLESNNAGLVESFKQQVLKKGLSTANKLSEDTEFMNTFLRFAEKNNLKDINLSALSKEKILEIILQKSGVGPCKFAQIISSDESIMSKLSPEIQNLIKKTQSENKFSRTLDEAQNVIRISFADSRKTLADKAFEIRGGGSAPLIHCDYTVKKPLSAGSVGETYLAHTQDKKQVIIKMIKQNIDKEQLELEQKLYSRLIEEFAPDDVTSAKQLAMLKNLYKDWGKELNFFIEHKNNKLLQQGAQRYKVADIIDISKDGRCIVMEKAEGIQMNELMNILKDFKTNPLGFHTKYASQIEQHPWLAHPDKVINELPESITKAFDEMFLFMKKDGKSFMHADPHMGNYFITSQNNKLIPVFIDTGNCLSRNSKQIQKDLQFLSDYFVGNSKGVAKYFIEQCDRDADIINKMMRHCKKLSYDENAEEKLINKIANEIRIHVFDKRHNITDVDSVQKTIQTILERNGLSMKPEASTAMKAQMQFFTGITEAASLSGRKVDVGAIVKDIPKALCYMIKSGENPIEPVKSALTFAYNNQQHAARIAYQFIGTKPSATINNITSINKKDILSLKRAYIPA